MSMDGLFAVSRFGLDFERTRMEVASQRIAAADMPLTQRAALASASGVDFSSLLGPAGSPVADGKSIDGGDTHQVLDPSNPAADADGMVSYPTTDLAQEMTTLMSAQRAYQADIRAFNALHGMLMKSLDIGGR